MATNPSPLPDLSGKIVSFTGHRPDKLGGYEEIVFFRLVALANLVMEQCKPEKVISGMALGWDQAVAFAACKAKIPVIAAIPHSGQEMIWPKKSQEHYHRILDRCTEVVLVNDGPFAGWKMHTRNEWMVDHSEHLMSLWDGSTGGTANCVRYAIRKKAPFTNLWPLWVKEYRDIVT